jgi:hypothetical protein
MVNMKTSLYEYMNTARGLNININIKLPITAVTVAQLPFFLKYL